MFVTGYVVCVYVAVDTTHWVKVKYRSVTVESCPKILIHDELLSHSLLTFGLYTQISSQELVNCLFWIDTDTFLEES